MLRSMFARSDNVSYTLDLSPMHPQAKTITVQAGARVSQVLDALRVSNSTERCGMRIPREETSPHCICSLMD